MPTGSSFFPLLVKQSNGCFKPYPILKILIMPPANLSVMGYPVFNGSLADIAIDGHQIINTINGHSYTVAKSDTQFRDALLKSDILLPDGEIIVWGAKLLGMPDLHKIAGYDLFLHLMHTLNERSGSCFFLGSSVQALEKIQDRVSREYPNVRVASYSPPYKAAFSADDNELMCSKVNSFGPDVLFVGMTAPKQEKWVMSNSEAIRAKLICSIGAVFDFYAGTNSRPPRWMIRAKLEWLGRLLKEPKRMWRRYLLSTPVFLIDVVGSKFRRPRFKSINT